MLGPSDGLLALATLFEQASFNDFHWSQLYASTRRRGRYWKLDLVKLGAGACSRSATVPYQHAVIEVRKTAESLTKETDSAITDHIAMRRDQFKEAWLDHRRALYEAWSQTLQTHFASPDSTPMWRDCVDRWGRERGYIADIAQRLRKEAEQAALKPKLVPPISGRLPKRPKLFSLQKIRLQNFRCVEEREINFAQTTVLIGNNGIGKTCWLEAIAAAIGIFLTGVGAANARTICETDIRHVYQERGGILTVTTNCPC